jgi:hypothetical protein
MAMTPSLDSVRKARADAAAEEAFWHDHYDGFLARYPDQFLAVARENGQAIVADPDLLSLLATISERGLDVGHVWVRYLARTPIHLAI